MAASYNVWDRDANCLWKGGTPREEVDSQVALNVNAVKYRKVST
jgi:hypothetical protein